MAELEELLDEDDWAATAIMDPRAIAKKRRRDRREAMVVGRKEGRAGGTKKGQSSLSLWDF